MTENMPTQAISQYCAQTALEQLLKDAKVAEETNNSPFQYLEVSHDTKEATEEVKRQWFAVSILWK